MFAAATMPAVLLARKHTIGDAFLTAKSCEHNFTGRNQTVEFAILNVFEVG